METTNHTVLLLCIGKRCSIGDGVLSGTVLRRIDWGRYCNVSIGDTSVTLGTVPLSRLVDGMYHVFLVFVSLEQICQHA